MRRVVLSLLIMFAVTLCGAADALRIVATTPDLGSVAQSIVGEHGKVDSIAKGTQDPHYVEAKPSYIRKVNRADVLIYTGMELEHAWLPLLIQGARNRRLTPGSRNLINASKAIPAKKKMEVLTGEQNRSQGDIHPLGNPHYMLDPRNSILVAKMLTERLSEIDPEHSAEYEANLAAFEKEFEMRIKDWKKRLEPWRGKKIVTFHKAWSYMARWLELDVIGTIEEKPGIAPGPRHLAELVARMKSEKVFAVVASSHVPPKVSMKTAERAGVPYIPLPPMVEAEKKVKTYADIFETIVARLEKAMSQNG